MASIIVADNLEFPIHRRKSAIMKVSTSKLKLDYRPFKVTDKTIYLLFECYRSALLLYSCEVLCYEGRVAFLVKGREALPVHLSTYNRIKRHVTDNGTIHIPDVIGTLDDPELFILRGITPEYVSIPFEAISGTVNLSSGVSYRESSDGVPMEFLKWLEVEV